MTGEQHYKKEKSGSHGDDQHRETKIKTNEIIIIQGWRGRGDTRRVILTIIAILQFNNNNNNNPGVPGHKQEDIDENFHI